MCNILMIRTSTDYVEATSVLQAKTTGGAFVTGPGAIVDYLANDISQGEWCMAMIIWKGGNNVNTFDLFVDESLRGKIQCAGAVTKVIGAYVGDGSDGIKSIAPVKLKPE